MEVSVTPPLGTSASPLRTSTRDSTWDGEILRGDALAGWDDDPRIRDFVNQVASGVELGKPPAYRYAAAISGKARLLSRPEYGHWKRRLLLDSGAVQRPTGGLAALPADAGDHARRLWPSIELLIQVRLLGGDSVDDPLPLTRRFLRTWVPMGETPVRAAMEELEALGLVIRDGTYCANGGRRMNLWRVAKDEAVVSSTAGGRRTAD